MQFRDDLLRLGRLPRRRSVGEPGPAASSAHHAMTHVRSATIGWKVDPKSAARDGGPVVARGAGRQSRCTTHGSASRTLRMYCVDGAGRPTLTRLDPSNGLSVDGYARGSLIGTLAATLAAAAEDVGRRTARSASLQQGACLFRVRPDAWAMRSRLPRRCKLVALNPQNGPACRSWRHRGAAGTGRGGRWPCSAFSVRLALPGCERDDQVSDPLFAPARALTPEACAAPACPSSCRWRAMASSASQTSTSPARSARFTACARRLRVELGDDLGDVELGRVGGDAERAADLAVAQAVAHLDQHLALARRQRTRSPAARCAARRRRS